MDFFNDISEKEVLSLFNKAYNGNKEYSIEDIKKELVGVEVANYEK